MARPNIILINCDDLGYGDLGCYGSPLHRTPAIDRLAAEGMRFTDFTMAAAVCSPSRGAMLTGCYPTRIGFGEFDNGQPVLFPCNSTGLHPEEITVATLLRSRGYATKLVGKWHCGDQPDFLPTRHGFDEYFGLPFGNDMGRQPSRRGILLPPLPLMRNEEVLELQPDQSALTERYLSESVEFVRANSGKPFFLYLAHMYVHLPIYAPERFLAQSFNGSYGAAVECIDWTVACLMRELKDLGIDKNTLIVFTSDNGSRGRDGGSNGLLRGAKGSSWEGGFRVPCLMRWPGHIAPGSVCSTHVCSLDFLPTFAALAGGDSPADRVIDGSDISQLIQGAEPSGLRETFAYYVGNTLEAVRVGQWKLHVFRQDQPICELYDLVADPGESREISIEHSDLLGSLQDVVESYRANLGDEAVGSNGSARRQAGKVRNPKPLSTYDPTYPYFCHEYDIPDVG